MTLSRNKRLFLLGVLLALAVAIPFTIFMVQQQQETRSKAAASTTLSFTPTSSTTTPLTHQVNDTIPLTVSINPGANLVSLVTLEILYDATRFEPSGTAAFTPNTAIFPRVVEGPVYTPGKIQVSLSIGSDPSQAVQSVSNVGTLTLKALANTSSPASISFGPNTKVFSIASTDQATENVLSTATPAYIQVGAMSACSNIPVGDTMLVVDTSGSTNEYRTAQKDGMKLFVDNLSAHNQQLPYKIGLISHAGGVRLNYSLEDGDNYTALKQAIDTMPYIDSASAGQTEALRMANAQLGTYARPGIRKIVVHLTDRSNSLAMAEAYKGFNEQGIAYYIIGYNISGSTRATLQKLATDTGGTLHVFDAASATSQENAWQEIADDVACPPIVPSVTPVTPTVTSVPSPTLQPVPTITFNANPTSVITNGSTTLTWSTTNATSCTASGGWTGTKATSGSQSSGPLTQSTTYTLTCSSTGGSTSRTVNVTVVTPSPTTTPIPTNTPIPTPTTAPLSTTLNFRVSLHGVGSSGDNSNPTNSSTSNKNPLNPSRQLAVEIMDANNVQILSTSATMTYQTATGDFRGNVALPTNFTSGSYLVRVKSGGYLRRLLFGNQQITQGTTNSLSAVALVAADTDNDNALTVLDYGTLLDCGYGDLDPLPMTNPNSTYNSTACKAHSGRNFADVNDNGVIDRTDFNLYLREIAVQNGD